MYALCQAHDLSRNKDGVDPISPVALYGRNLHKLALALKKTSISNKINLGR